MKHCPLLALLVLFDVREESVNYGRRRLRVLDLFSDDATSEFECELSDLGAKRLNRREALRFDLLVSLRRDGRGVSGRLVLQLGEDDGAFRARLVLDVGSLGTRFLKESVVLVERLRRFGLSRLGEGDSAFDLFFQNMNRTIANGMIDQTMS